MSTTIKYKGDVLATLENESITLKTANTYAEADVELNAVGGDPDGKTYQDQYKYVVLEDGEDEDVKTEARNVIWNGLIEAADGKAFDKVTVDIDQVRDLLKDSFYDITDVDLNGLETIGAYAFYGRTNLISISSKTIKTIENNAFDGSNLMSVDLPNLQIVKGNVFYNTKLRTLFLPHLTYLGGNYPFSHNSLLKTVVLPRLSNHQNNTGFFFRQDSALEKVDFEVLPKLQAGIFSQCSVLNILILRKSDTIVTLQDINALTSDTPFASGGAGGTIYIPKVLYDELGTGSTLDYKATTNWSTLDGYGTITWAQIEGSQYEHYYADGHGVLQNITQNLINCTIDNDLAHYHTEYITQIVPDDGYATISGVSVSMDGVDITSSAYDAASRTITIDSPDGEIVITATGGV